MLQSHTPVSAEESAKVARYPVVPGCLELAPTASSEFYRVGAKPMKQGGGGEGGRWHFIDPHACFFAAMGRAKRLPHQNHKRPDVWTYLARNPRDPLPLGEQDVVRHELVPHVVHVDRVSTRSVVFAYHLCATQCDTIRRNKGHDDRVKKKKRDKHTGVQ